MAKEKKQSSNVSIPNDIFTSLLGLATLVLAGTCVFICLRSWEFYGTFFEF